MVERIRLSESAAEYLNEFIPATLPNLKGPVLLALAQGGVSDRVYGELLESSKIGIARHDADERLIEVVAEALGAP